VELVLLLHNLAFFRRENINIDGAVTHLLPLLRADDWQQLLDNTGVEEQIEWVQSIQIGLVPRDALADHRQYKSTADEQCQLQGIPEFLQLIVDPSTIARTEV
jgi:hypothetical protein